MDPPQLQVVLGFDFVGDLHHLREALDFCSAGVRLLQREALDFGLVDVAATLMVTSDLPHRLAAPEF